MQLFGKEIKLVIFDLDGTLIDSTSLWIDIDNIFFSRRGMEVPPTYGTDIAHMGLDAAATFTRINYCPDETEAAIMKEWHDLSVDGYLHHIPLKDGAKEVLELFKRNNVIIALATANSKELYEPCLTRLGIAPYFSYIIDVKSVKNGKNSPEIYNRVTEHFNLDKDNVLIIEDMLTPMKTAFKAGYNVIGVFDKHSTTSIQEAKANSNLFIYSFKELL